MTDDSQSHQEAVTLRADSLHPKTTRRVGCWNVRTLYQTGKLAQVVREMECYNIELLGICETRWTGSGSRQLVSGHQILYSGRSDDHHSRGVAIITTKEVHKSLLEWNPVSERIIKARYNSAFAKLTTIVCYAPTEDADEEEKDVFYDKLQEIIDETPSHDMLLLMGDLNAKVGTENKGRENTMGKQGIGECNNNGERLTTLCQENNLVIGGTIFVHKKIHKVTWNSPDGHTQNQIDHIIINNRWRGSLQDVVARRGADVGSDHTLVLAKVRLKLRKAKRKSERPPPIDVEKLKNPKVCKTFQVEVQNRFSVLQEQTEMELHHFNEVLLKASKKVLGSKKKKKEEWITVDTWKKIDERKEKKHKILTTRSERVKEKLETEYKILDKEVKRKTRDDKKAYIDGLAEEAETAASKQDLRTLYRITKTLKGGFQTTDLPVKNQQGKLCAREEDTLKCWKDHFEKILNRSDPETEANIEPAEECLDINTGPPSVEEVKRAIKTMKNGKAPGIDQIHAEMLKADEHVTPSVLTSILCNIWESEKSPTFWKTGLIVKLPKKGELTNCNNWRGIMLLSVTSKVLSRVILNRITSAVDPLLRSEQAGFRKGRSCTDQIFTLRQIIEQSNEWNTTTYANFIDFAKAFDSINRPALWRIMSHYGIPDKIISIIKMLYTDFNARVICGSKLTDTFPIQTGVKQGCLLSPLLFSLCIDWLMRETTRNTKRGITWTFGQTLEDLDFADDIVLLAHRYQDIQNKTIDMATTGKKIGLSINTDKTKVMKINEKSKEQITINNNTVEEVQDFNYLGSKISLDGNSETDVQSRISKARGTFASLKNIWKSNKISTQTKLRIFKSNVLGVLLYSAESWKVTKNICNKLDVFQTKCLRRIMKIFWPNTISNQELYKRTDSRPLSVEIKRRRWRWIGHVCRMHPDSIPRVAMRWTPQGKRKRGRPKETWRRSVEKEMKDLGWSWGQIQHWSQDRQHWRSLVVALCAKQHEED
jgi:hypothetical protein